MSSGKRFLPENLILTLGFRFQWIRIHFTEDLAFDSTVVKPEEWVDYYIYCAFVRVMFIF